jgi:hypothetical protein
MARGVSLRHFLSLGAAVMLAACGGSSSKDDPPPPPPVVRPPATVGYTGATTPASVTTSSAGTLLTSAFAGGSGMVSVAGGASAGGAASGTARIGIREAKQLLGARRAQIGASVVGAYQAPFTEPCLDGGTVTTEIDELDEDPTTTDVGDFYSVTFDACSEYGTTQYGSMTLTIDATDGADFMTGDYSLFTDGVTYTTTLVFTDYYLVDDVTDDFFGMSGDVSFDETIDYTTYYPYGYYESWVYGVYFEMVAGNGATVTEAYSMEELTPGAFYYDGYQEVWDNVTYAMLYYGYDLSGWECSLEMNGCVAVQTPAPLFQYEGDLYPYDGEFKVTDDTGDYVRMVMMGDGTIGDLDLYYSVDGGTTEQGPFISDWACLESADSASCFVAP